MSAFSLNNTSSSVAIVKRLAPTWNELAKVFNDKEEQEVVIAKVDCTVETALCADNDVTGYPTIKFFSNGKDGAVRYKGGGIWKLYRALLRNSLERLIVQLANSCVVPMKSEAILLCYSSKMDKEKYAGQRDLSSFKEFIKRMVDQKDENAEREEEKVPEKVPTQESEVSVFYTAYKLQKLSQSL
ncbi:ERP46 [Mytilus edulis]|uniref:TXNDC5 n=1 Tax=Mytilus edulis TaxID=6550 RepID=A0A8S3UY61_MYTED|nr:ERP46 [Mytilus edulis]